MPHDELAKRLATLEAHIAHVERQFDQLNEVVIEQARELRRIVALQQRISDTLATQELERVRATSPKPPHYQ